MLMKYNIIISTLQDKKFKMSNAEITKKVRVAVLMAAYNAEDTIKSAVDSVLASVVSVDLYIIDDGSKTPVAEYLYDMPENVYIHRLAQNSGLPAALNEGLGILLEKDYEFIARFDADDFCYPERFIAQMEYMDNHLDIMAVGCWANAIGEDSENPLFTIAHPEHHNDIVKAMYYNAAFIHPSLFFRSSSLKELEYLYNTNYRIAQDYEIMSRFIQQFKTANVPQVLLDYSYLSEISSSKKRRHQLKNRMKIQMMYFRPSALHSWLGILKTTGLFLMPMRVTTYLKGFILGTKK